MNALRLCIVLMSGLGVVSDAVLIAFYPQFFHQRYGLDSAVHVGAYIAAISVAVMFTLPLWARVARRTGTMRLLLATQAAAGLLCVLSAWAPDVPSYWALSLLMFTCKSSYLLMFPYLMRQEAPARHATTVGLLSVVVHMGGILGAVAGGSLLQTLGPDSCLWLMAAGDFAQMALCAWLVASGTAPADHAAAAEADAPGSARPASAARLGDSDPRGALGQAASRLPWGIPPAVMRLGLVMLVFDFGAYLVRPFFTLHWERLSGLHHEAVTGAVFAIPAALALLALAWNHQVERGRLWPLHQTQPNLMLGALGLALQAAPSVPLMLLGRCLFGWSLFQVIVKLEVSLFKLSTPATYARDYSLTNFCQNLGVLLSSFAAGLVVDRHGIAVTFAIAAVGFVLTALLEHRLVGVDRLPSPAPSPALPTVPTAIPSAASTVATPPLETSAHAS